MSPMGPQDLSGAKGGTVWGEQCPFFSHAFCEEVSEGKDVTIGRVRKTLGGQLGGG